VADDPDRSLYGGRHRRAQLPETAHWLEWQDWANPVLAEPFKVQDSQLVIPTKPGCGIDWDENAVKRFRYDV
jgi:mandelate racemase